MNRFDYRHRGKLHPISRVFLLILLILVMGVFVGFPMLSSAQTSQQISFRLSRLETENRMLQSRINQLESQISRLSRATGIQVPTAPTPSPDDFEASPTPRDPMFDRLATLVIETRQDVFTLQDRLTAIEDRLNISPSVNQ